MRRSFRMAAVTVSSMGWLGGCEKESSPASTLFELTMETRFPHPFGHIGSMRELPDGRILIPDPLGQVLVRVDFRSEVPDTIGRRGEGPREYAQPDAVLPLPGDSSLLVDLGNTRLTTLDPAGELIHSVPLAQHTTTGEVVLLMPRGTDGNGRLYFRGELSPFRRYPDSAAVLRFDPLSRDLDTVGLVRIPNLGPPPLPGEPITRTQAFPLEDDWSVGPDGRVAFIRSGDYSVDWISPGGSRSEGPPNTFKRIEVGDEEKAAWIEESNIDRVGMVSTDGGDVTGFRGRADRKDLTFQWPDLLPPFKPGRSIICPQGRVWVERYVSAGAYPVVDVFDRQGHRVGEVSLPLRRRLAGFGARWVYLVFTDDFGLEWIERHTLEEYPAATPLQEEKAQKQ